jgi:hypothetical protein
MSESLYTKPSVSLSDDGDCENPNGHVAGVNPICIFCGAKLRWTRPLDVEAARQQIEDIKAAIDDAWDAVLRVCCLTQEGTDV